MASEQSTNLIGRELRELRSFRGLTAREVDAALGWRVNKTTEIERGAINLKYDDVARYVELFGLTIADFEKALEERRAYEESPVHSKLIEAVGEKTSYVQTGHNQGLWFVSPDSDIDVPVGLVS